MPYLWLPAVLSPQCTWIELQSLIAPCAVFVVAPTWAVFGKSGKMQIYWKHQNGFIEVSLQSFLRKQAMLSAAESCLSPLFRTEAVTWWEVSWRSLCVHPQPCSGNAVPPVFISTEVTIPPGTSAWCLAPPKHWNDWWNHCQLEFWVGNAGDRSRIPGFHLCLTQCVISNSKWKSNQGMPWSVTGGSCGINECLSNLV